MLTTDFLDAERLILDRLRDQCPGIQHVLSAADIDGVRERQQLTPAAHVLYDGYSVQQTQANRALIRQSWLVVVAVRHAGQREQVARQREVAGPLVLEVLRALMGWRPSAEHSPLVLASAPYRPEFGGGFAYLPVAFTTDIKVTGVD